MATDYYTHMIKCHMIIMGGKTAHSENIHPVVTLLGTPISEVLFIASAFPVELFSTQQECAVLKP